MTGVDVMGTHEALIYCVGSMKFLTGNATIAKQLVQKDCIEKLSTLLDGINKLVGTNKWISNFTFNIWSCLTKKRKEVLSDISAPVMFLLKLYHLWHKVWVGQRFTLMIIFLNSVFIQVISTYINNALFCLHSCERNGWAWNKLTCPAWWQYNHRLYQQLITNLCSIYKRLVSYHDSN